MIELPGGSAVFSSQTVISVPVTLNALSDSGIFAVVCWETYGGGPFNDPEYSIQSVTLGSDNADLVGHVIAPDSNNIFKNIISIYQVVGKAVNQLTGLQNLTITFDGTAGSQPTKVYLLEEEDVDQSAPLLVSSATSLLGSVSIDYSEGSFVKTYAIANHMNWAGTWQIPANFVLQNRAFDFVGGNVDFMFAELQGQVQSPAVIGTDFDNSRLAGVVLQVQRRSNLEAVAFDVPLRRTVGFLKPLRRTIGIKVK